MPKKTRKAGRSRPVPERAAAGGVDAAASHETQICTVCKRDPNEVPAAKVVAHGLCAKDYNRARREARRRAAGEDDVIPTTRRLGVKARVTIWMTQVEQVEVKQAAREKRKSVSDWGAELLLAGVADHKKTTGATTASAK